MYVSSNDSQYLSTEKENSAKGASSETALATRWSACWACVTTWPFTDRIISPGRKMELANGEVGDIRATRTRTSRVVSNQMPKELSESNLRVNVN
mmetsp:Transcript_2795/g.3953  ORF Transcript_2795/g.3953 Transcript_2795/m.3953 type:complete len:95 (-) Transcript_2795:13-297(-)